MEDMICQNAEVTANLLFKCYQVMGLLQGLVCISTYATVALSTY